VLTFSPGLACKSTFFVLCAAHPASVRLLLHRRLVNTNKCTLGRKRRAGLQFSGQLRADKTTQTNATDTTAAGGAPEQTYHRHLRPLIRRDAFAMRGGGKKRRVKCKSPTGPCKPRRLVSFLHFFSKKNFGSFENFIASKVKPSTSFRVSSSSPTTPTTPTPFTSHLPRSSRFILFR
jgi:hypothetical protein